MCYLRRTAVSPQGSKAAHICVRSDSTGPRADQHKCCRFDNAVVLAGQLSNHAIPLPDWPVARDLSVRHSRARRLEPAEVDELLTRYLDGEPVSELTQEFGMHRSTLHEHRAGRGLPSRDPHRALDDKQITHAAWLYRTGLSTLAIARDYGVHPATVARALKRAGIELRPKGRGGRRP